MRILLNILWIICGGFLSALGWLITGLCWCITVIGIPVGLQCFKMASVSLNPFGKEVINGGGAGSLLLNILWIIFGGLISWLSWILAGCLWCVTVVGIPVGLQCFKLASISLNPFGKEVQYEGGAVSFLLNVVWFLLSGLLLALENFVFGCILCSLQYFIFFLCYKEFVGNISNLSIIFNSVPSCISHTCNFNICSLFK